MKQFYLFKLPNIKLQLFFNIAVMLLCLLGSMQSFGQTTLFSEDFEAATGSQNFTGPYLGWQSLNFGGANANFWWIFDNTRTTVLGDNYSIAVSRNTPYTGAGVKPRYTQNSAQDTGVYNTTLINAIGYAAVTLDFNWICRGESDYDYGRVMYSTDGFNWTILPDRYQNQTTTQTVTGLDISGVAGQNFYIGFKWDNDNSIGNNPAFIVDDIVVKGYITPPITYCEPTSEEPQWVFIDDIRFMGSLNDVDNLNSGYTNGYQDHTALPNAVQEQGEGFNIYYFNDSYTGGAYVKAWVDWNQDGDFTDTGELVYETGNVSTTSASFGVVIPLSTPPGDYRIRIRNNVTYDGLIGDYIVYNFDSCEDFDYTFFDYYDGEAEDYLFTVVERCPATISTVTDGETCDTGTVNLEFTGATGVTGFNVYANETDTTPLSPAPTFNTPGGVPTGSWTTPTLATTTTYWVTAINGSCESLVKTKILAEIKPTPTVAFTPAAPIICGQEIIQLTAGGDTEEDFLLDEDFEGGGLGVFTNFNDNVNGAPYDGITVWQNETSPYIPNNTEVWSPAISSGLRGNRFVMSTSDVNPPGNVYQYLQLATPVDASDYTNLKLTFDIYYSAFGDQIQVQVDNGSGWSTISTYTTSIGIGTRFENQNIDLSTYDASATLSIRIQFLSGWGDGIAVDNIKLFGDKPLNTAFNYDTSLVDAYTDAAASVGYEYVPNTPIETIYIRPTMAQLENATFTIPVSATLSNGCSASGNVVVTNNTKIFSGATTNWNDINNWKPAGVPTIENCIIIPDYTTTNNNISNINGTVNGEGYNLLIQDNGTLHMDSDATLTLQDNVIVEPAGMFEMEDSASLVQVNNVPNTGNVRIIRDSQPMYRYDYTYWSSPLTAASNYTLDDLSPDTLGDKYFSWNPTQSGGHGTWVTENPNTRVMTPSTGFAVRAPQTYSTNPAIKTSYSAIFTGTPNNGDITTTIVVGTDVTAGQTSGTDNTIITADDDQWNLIGNPYPSAIDIIEFLDFTGNVALLDGTAYVWTHNSAPSTGATDPFYGDYAYNYTSNDYASINSLGAISTAATGGQAPTRFFASGQAFFVLGLANGNAVFNNSMRDKDFNDNFFKTSGQNNTSNFTEFEKHRFWLNLCNDTGAFSQTLIGYAEGATLGWDRGKDALYFGGNDVSFYSITPDFKLNMQGKPLPFETSDVVPLGYQAVNQGVYRIGIDHHDPLFDSQDIFIRDKALNTVHNLKTAPYIFNTDAGRFDERFEIIYTTETLSTNEYVLESNEIKVISGNDLEVISNSKIIKTIEVYNILGKKLMTYNTIEANKKLLKGIKKSNNALIIKIELKDTSVVYKKVIY